MEAFLEARRVRAAARLKQPLRAVQTTSRDGARGKSFSFVQQRSGGLQMMAL